MDQETLEKVEELFSEIKDDAAKGQMQESKEKARVYLESILQSAAQLQRLLA